MVSNLIVLVGSEFHTILLMEEILHQLRLVVYPIFLQGFIHPRWCRISSIINSRSMNYKTPRYFVHHENPAIFPPHFSSESTLELSASQRSTAFGCAWGRKCSACFLVVSNIIFPTHLSRKYAQKNVWLQPASWWFPTHLSRNLCPKKISTNNVHEKKNWGHGSG